MPVLYIGHHGIRGRVGVGDRNVLNRIPHPTPVIDGVFETQRWERPPVRLTAVP